MVKITGAFRKTHGLGCENRISRSNDERDLFRINDVNSMIALNTAQP